MDENRFGATESARLARIHADLSGWTTQLALEAWQRALGAAENAEREQFNLVGPEPVQPVPATSDELEGLEGAIGGRIFSSVPPTPTHPF